LVCWTGRVGLVCRDCREALTTGDARGARRTSKRAAIEGATGTPSLQRFTPTTGAPMLDPSMTCGSLTYSERQVRYEAQKTRKSASALKKAVKKVGSSRKRVERRLGH
jgi:Protein of unknown function (DUF3606)